MSKPRKAAFRADALRALRKPPAAGPCESCGAQTSERCAQCRLRYCPECTNEKGECMACEESS